MSAPMLWMGIPILSSFVMAIFYRHSKATSLAGSILSGGLALLAIWLPIEESTVIGPWKVELAARVDILGRSLTIENSDRPLLAFFFLAGFIWFTASRAADVHRMFVPLGMTILVLLIAALSVEPFLYAALFIEMAVLISIPMLNPPGSSPGQGILRYLIFQTMAMPFILFTGWMLTGLEAGSADLATTLRAGVLLGLGFSFLLAVFPFYTWIPLLAEQVNPFVGGFVLYLLPTASLLFGISFFERNAWIRSSESLPTLLTVMGALMVVTGGLWSMFQNHLARIFGYAVIIETGFSLLAAGLGRQEQFSSFALLFMPRLAATAVWVLCLAIIEKKTGTLRMQDLRSLGKGAPFLAGGLLVAQLSLAGLPVLASFPAKYNILARIAAESPATAAWLLIGIFGSLLAALRTAYIFFLPVDLEKVTPSTRWQRVLILAGVGVLFTSGLFPQIVLIPFRDILQAFQTLLGT